MNNLSAFLLVAVVTFAALAVPAFAQLSGPIDLATVGGVIPGVTFNGINAGDRVGASISSAGDVNGDGLADLLIGAPLADPNGDSNAGETYLVYGRAGFAASFNLTAADVTFVGVDAGELSGTSVSSAGDLNGDGFADLLIGARGADPNGEPNAGKTYLVYGSSSLAANFDLAAANVTFVGIDAGDESGVSVSTAGDVNGDGLDDLLIGADGGVGESPGETYLIYGSTGLTMSIDLANADVTFNGIDARDRTGQSVSSAGDVNGDGFADLLIGANGGDPNGDSAAGETYLIYGSASLGGSFDLANADVTFEGIDSTDNSGYSVSSAGDVNGDGLADLLIGAFQADPTGDSNGGETYLVYGSASLPASFDLAGADVTFLGIDPADQSGATVSSAGDVNGDGLGDLLIGAAGGDPNGESAAGETYLIYGSVSLASVIDLANAAAVFNGDAGDQSGFSVSPAGDVNGDGLDDFLIGANFADPNGNSGAGKAYLIYGQSSIDADFDGDGDIDGADFLTWQRGVSLNGAAATHQAGNANGDQSIDGEDLTVWRSQFGYSSARYAGAPVPEPGTVALALLAIASAFVACNSSGYPAPFKS